MTEIASRQVARIDGTGGEERFRHIQISLDGIRSSLSKGMWIVMTAVIGGVLAFALNEGLDVAH